MTRMANEPAAAARLQLRGGKVKKRTLGRSNLEVSALGFGCMGLSFGFLVAPLCAQALQGGGASGPVAPAVTVARAGSQPSVKGAAETFTGAVRVDFLFQPSEPSRTSAAYVTFEPGARTAWHTHPLGPEADRDGWLRMGSAVGRSKSR